MQDLSEGVRRGKQRRATLNHYLAQISMSSQETLPTQPYYLSGEALGQQVRENAINNIIIYLK